jgi:hypothetical protein
LQVISAMVDSDYMSLVKTRPVGQWRETLAVLATYTGQMMLRDDLLACRACFHGVWVDWLQDPSPGLLYASYGTPGMGLCQFIVALHEVCGS